MCVFYSKIMCVMKPIYNEKLPIHPKVEYIYVTARFMLQNIYKCVVWLLLPVTVVTLLIILFHGLYVFSQLKSKLNLDLTSKSNPASGSSAISQHCETSYLQLMIQLHTLIISMISLYVSSLLNPQHVMLMKKQKSCTSRTFNDWSLLSINLK